MTTHPLGRADIEVLGGPDAVERLVAHPDPTEVLDYVESVAPDPLARVRIAQRLDALRQARRAPAPPPSPVVLSEGAVSVWSDTAGTVVAELPPGPAAA